MISFIKQLVRVPSVTGNQKEIQKCFDIIVQQFGDVLNPKYKAFRNRRILILSNTNQKKVDIIFLCHIDVVGLGNTPINPMQKNGRLYGRGAYDMKGPLAATLFGTQDFLLFYPNNGVKIACIITADEETDALSSQYICSELEYKSSFAIVPDGGSMKEIITKEKGFVQFEVEVFGKGCHAAYPWRQRNPIDVIYSIYADLQKKFIHPKSVSDWKTSVVLTVMHAGNQNNQIPVSARACFDARYVSIKDKKHIENIIRKHIKAKDKCSIIAESPLLEVYSKEKAIILLQKAIKRTTGKKPKCGQEPGTSDAAFFANVGIPAALIRPDGDNAHQDDEWVSISSLKKFRSAIKEFLLLCASKKTK